jgi:hypothetical protein
LIRLWRFQRIFETIFRTGIYDAVEVVESEEVLKL